MTDSKAHLLLKESEIFTKFSIHGLYSSPIANLIKISKEIYSNLCA